MELVLLFCEAPSITIFGVPRPELIGGIFEGGLALLQAKEQCLPTE